MSDAEENRLRYLRARELLDGLGWLFDGFIAAEMKAIYDSNIHDPKTREEAYRRAKVAGEMKDCLQRRLDEYENEQTVLKHKEAKNGTREQPLN